MKRSGDEALDQALALHHLPGSLGAIRHMELPKDLQVLLRIAAGDSEVTVRASELTGEPPAALREVAIFFLQQLLFAEDRDSYRALGVTPDAPDELIKLHYRWLVRWLHPDRNPDEWESVFAERINLAWQDLRTPSRRNAYDLNRGAENRRGSDQGREGFPGKVLGTIPTPAQPPNTRSVRWLPTFVLASVGLVTIVSLGVIYELQTMNQEAGSQAVSSISAEPSLAELAPPATVVADAPLFDASPGKVPVPSQPAPAVVPASVRVPDPMPVSAPTESLSAATNVAGPNSVKLALAQARLMAKAEQPSASNPAPVTTTKTASATRATKSHSAPIEAAVRSMASATISGDVSNRASMETTRPMAPKISSQSLVVESGMSQGAVANDAQPAPTDVAFQARSEGTTLIDDRVAASLVSRFSQAYANGDTQRLMQLFTHDAQNGHGDRRAIAEDYQRLFQSSERRRIAVRDMSWLTVGNGATIIASFETEVVPRGKNHGEHASGDIRFDLREEDGELRIYRLSHDNRRS